MAKRIKIISAFLIVTIITVACTAITVVNGKNIDAVQNTVMADNTSDSLCIKWQEVKKAEGYHIYSLNKETNEYEKIADVTGGDVCSYELENIEDGAIYQIKVTAYKMFRNKEYESESSDTVTVYTLPKVSDVNASSKTEGVFEVKWAQNKNAAGYEVEYGKNEDFSDATKETFTDNQTDNFKVDGLTPKDVYCCRVRSFIKVNEENVYGEWSNADKVEIKEKFIMNSDIDVKKPMIALTFDDGPGYPCGKDENPTKEILDVLEEYNARATFFMVASRINSSNDECLKREIKLGCELGNHTISHNNYGKKVTANDISDCSNRIKEKSGQGPTVFRCPGGMMTKTIQNECVKECMPIVYWSIDTEDWKSKNPDSIYKIATSRAYDGAIILMHDIYPSTAEAVKKIVPKLIEDGYQLVTVSEMLAAKNNGKEPEAGQQYVDYKTINNNT